ncbi:MAG: hypothetical protein PHN92_09520 [Geobacter sp.]|nr:hypothetical protein [Geobacter sp.]
MKMKTVLAVLLMGVLTAGAAFGFGMPSFGGGSKSAPAGDPDAFLAKAKATEALVNKSVDQLAGLLLTKDQKAKIEAEKEAAAKLTDPKEKDAALAKVRDSEIAAFQKLKDENKLEAQAKQLDSKQKKLAGAALYNLGLGALQATDLVQEGQNMAKSMQSNPMLAMKAGSILESVKSLGGIVSGTAKVLAFLPPVFSAAKIDVPKATSKESKPMDTEA